MNGSSNKRDKVENLSFSPRKITANRRYDRMFHIAHSHSRFSTGEKSDKLFSAGLQNISAMRGATLFSSPRLCLPRIIKLSYLQQYATSSTCKISRRAIAM